MLFELQHYTSKDLLKISTCSHRKRGVPSSEHVEISNRSFVEIKSLSAKNIVSEQQFKRKQRHSMYCIFAKRFAQINEKRHSQIHAKRRAINRLPKAASKVKSLIRATKQKHNEFLALNFSDELIVSKTISITYKLLSQSEQKEQTNSTDRTDTKS